MLGGLQETAQRRDVRATIRAMVKIKRARKAAKEGKVEEEAPVTMTVRDTVLEMPNQEDVLQPTRFSGPYQKVGLLSLRALAGPCRRCCLVV